MKLFLDHRTYFYTKDLNSISAPDYATENADQDIVWWIREW